MLNAGRFGWDKFIQKCTKGFNHFNIFALIMAANIVCLTHDTFGNHLIQGPRVVFDIQPVAYLRTIAIHR